MVPRSEIRGNSLSFPLCVPSQSSAMSVHPFMQTAWLFMLLPSSHLLLTLFSKVGEWNYAKLLAHRAFTWHTPPVTGILGFRVLC